MCNNLPGLISIWNDMYEICAKTFLVPFNGYQIHQSTAEKWHHAQVICGQAASFVLRKEGDCLEKEIMQGTTPGAKKQGNQGCGGWTTWNNGPECHLKTY